VAGNVREYEYNVALAACLAEVGWDAEVDGQGGWGIIVEVPEDQRDQYRMARDSCASELGSMLETTPETVEYSYDNFVRVDDCLKDLGYETPTPPDFQIFLEMSLEDPNVEVWNPYSYVPDDELPRAGLACPQ
jgi:hypothetical protein